MKVAALYDIHANLPALEAVLREIRQIDVSLIVIGGDVLPGPMPREAFACLLALEIPMRFIMGNGDREVLAQMRGVETEWYAGAREAWREPVRWSAQQLDADHERLIANWPATCQVEIPGIGDTLFCHATPRNDTEIFTCLTAEERLLPVFEGVREPLVVCGHTHMPFDRRVGNVRVVNAGSVGMPFGEPGAYWLLLGPDIELRRTPYDLAAAAECIRRTPYPQANDFARHSVLEPPPESAILAAYSKAELK